jgi:twinkle protein
VTDILSVKRSLSAQAQSVAEHLLPNGRKEGHEWRAGSVNGEAGGSLGVHLTGEKAGIWKDFATGEGGDLLDLWCAVRRIKLGEALKHAREWLGVSHPKPYREAKKPYARPPRPACSAPRERVLDYLREVRNLSAEAIAAYKVGEQGNKIIFPFLLPDGELALVKAREAVDGATPVPTSCGFEHVLFGWQAIPDDAREVVITEGELDALSMWDYGHPALSVPIGGGNGGNQQWIENEFERMERFERIYLVLDHDETGDKAAGEIARRLGRHRCFRVMLPCKDANECLVAGIGAEAIKEAIANAESFDPDGLRRPTFFASAVTKLFWPTEGESCGYRMPYRKLGDKLLFRPSELTLWSGAVGAGKSQILSDCVVDWVHQKSRVCLCSFEMKAEQTLRRMCKQAGNVDRPTEEYICQALTWLDQGLLIYDHVGKEPLEGALEILDYARAKYGCDQFVIDSLMRLGVDGDDYSGQERVLFRLVDWVIANDAHIHLVAHSRKGDRTASVPDIEDVKGAMEIGANAFNIVTVWRNRKREGEIEREQDDQKQREMLDEMPTVILNVCKQRNGDYEGKVGLWFDRASYRYRSSYDQRGDRNYLPIEERRSAA